MDPIRWIYGPAFVAGLFFGAPLARAFHAAYTLSEERYGPFPRWKRLTHTLLTPVVATAIGGVAGALLSHEQDSLSWTGAVWGCAGAVWSPYLWPAVVQHLRSTLTSSDNTSVHD